MSLSVVANTATSYLHSSATENYVYEFTAPTGILEITAVSWNTKHLETGEVVHKLTYRTEGWLFDRPEKSALVTDKILHQILEKHGESQVWINPL